MGRSSDIDVRAEEIVLLDPAGKAVGTAPKIASHHDHTPLHLAFSCYLIDRDGRVLITQRAHEKLTFPSVWTNSCCGHPAPGEGLRQAVQRRLQTELGATVTGMTLALPEFTYRAVAANGVVENEQCPVVRAVAAGEIRPNPAEVAATEWRDWDTCLELAGHPESSPWYRLQLAELAPLGAPLDWPDADTALLPPAIAW